MPTHFTRQSNIPNSWCCRKRATNSPKPNLTLLSLRLTMHGPGRYEATRNVVSVVDLRWRFAGRFRLHSRRFSHDDVCGVFLAAPNETIDLLGRLVHHGLLRSARKRAARRSGRD